MAATSYIDTTLVRIENSGEGTEKGPILPGIVRNRMFRKEVKKIDDMSMKLR